MRLRNAMLSAALGVLCYNLKRVVSMIVFCFSRSVGPIHHGGVENFQRKSFISFIYSALHSIL
jgi:hypothetical protein